MHALFVSRSCLECSYSRWQGLRKKLRQGYKLSPLIFLESPRVRSKLNGADGSNGINHRRDGSSLTFMGRLEKGSSREEV